MGSKQSTSITQNLGRQPRLLPALALTAFSAALVACGGGGSSGGASSNSSGDSATTPAPIPGAAAPTQTVQYVFGKSASDGSYPYAALTQASDGNLYGTTFAGGANNAGTVFRAAPGGTPQTIYSFGSSANDGASPIAGLVQGVDGALYGTTSDRGASGQGTVFKITTSGTLTTLHAFGSGTDGAKPSGTLVLGSDGNLYGTTQAGGTNGGGTVYRLAQDGTLTTLYSFGSNVGDGAGPYAGLVQAADGNFYGTTPLGGTNNEGLVYRVTPGGAVSTVYAFSPITANQNADGALPYSGLVVGQDGALYGTTSYGGSSNYGTAYKVTTSGAFTALHQFAGGTDGAYPRAGLSVDTDGTLVGSASGAGSSNGGVLFRLSPSGTLTTLYAFAATAATGSAPYAALVKASDGGFYGTTLGGGNGTLFSWK
jgi:uncharacterized repeat protein (TIGR03803 family)